MLNKLYITMLVGLVAPLCDPISNHQDLYDAYVNTSMDILGQGGFGVVYQLVHDSQTYAVKEVELKSDPMKALEHMKTIANREEVLNHFNSLIARTPGFDQINSIKNIPEIPQSFLENKTVNSALQLYFGKLKRAKQMLRNEVNFNIQVQGIAQNNPGKFSYGYRFCIKLDEINYLIFMDKFNLSMRSDAFLKYFAKLNMEKRLGYYLMVMQRVHQLHLNGIVHCDLKEHNLIFTDNKARDLVIINYGLATQANICDGGTSGYIAPEANNEYEVSADIPTFAPRADVYSIGAMIARMELRRVNSSSFFDSLRNYYDSDSIFNNNSVMLNKLKKDLQALGKVESTTANDASAVSLFYDLLIGTLSNMLVANVSRRSSMRQAYRALWKLQRIAPYLDSFLDDMIKEGEKVVAYLENVWGNQDPMDLPNDVNVSEELAKYRASIKKSKKKAIKKLI